MIDANVVRSPGWYFKSLMNKLSGRKRLYDLNLLNDYLIGNPPMPQGAENAREAYAAFMKMARTNFAELITSACAHRMRPIGFSSLRESDATGDPELGSLWLRAGLNITAGDVHRRMLALRETYVVVGEVDEDSDAAVVTCEDPRWMIGVPDPAKPRRLKAALKVRYDEEDDVDRAYLHLDGSVFGRGERAEVWVASRKAYGKLGGLYGFDARQWTWDEQRSGQLAHDRISVVRFANLDDMGEYEPHLPLLDRINHQLLQRMTVAVMQAFRQRAILGLPQHYPDDYEVEELRGTPINYEGVFRSDPAALWQLPGPKDASVWESGQIDLTPLLSAVQADVQHLAFVTSTPLHMMDTGGDNQSAEGAGLQREGLLFKAKDRIDRVRGQWSDVVGLMLRQAGQTDRRLIASLRTNFAPPELLSLSERADAASKASNDIPRRSRLLDIWGFPPEVVDRMMTEWTEEQLLAQQLAQVTAAATPLPARPTAQIGQPADPAAQPAAVPGRPAPAALPAGAAAA